MIKIEITAYKKGKTATYTVSLPQSWQELTAMGFDPYATLKILLSTPGVSAKVQLLQTLMKLPRRIFNNIADDDMAALVLLLECLTLDASPDPRIVEFTHLDTLYILPLARFENGTALEFAIADDCFKKITSTPDENALLQLCATLCRPQNPDHAQAVIAGDRRIPLKSRGEVLHRAQAFKTLDPSVQVAVFLYFAGVKKYIFDLYGAAIFTRPEEETDLDGNPTAPADAPQSAEELFGWWGIFMELAENPKNMPAIHHMNFHDLCLWLVRKKIQADKMKNLFPPNNPQRD